MTKRARNVANDILDCVETATAKWTRQKKSEERHPGNVRYRVSRMTHESRISLKDAAWSVMRQAYTEASTNDTLPANARQIMYAARPTILKLTDKDALSDTYFTQVLLPDFIEEHPELTKDWDVVFDDRGTFIEPHTGRVVPLGTLEVLHYLGLRAAPERPASFAADLLASTAGPKNRYLNILFIEKEGFSALLAHALIAERFDLAIMSTKGMSVTAARMLLDRLAPYIRRVFVLHDFDISGFSIFGTLAKSSRRYRFANEVPIIDLGLRLADIDKMELEPEPYTPGSWGKRSATARRHGATDDEISFMATKRVELNAMTSGQFIAFLERKLVEHHVEKVVPDDAELQRHARHVIERTLLNNAIEKIRQEVVEAAAAVALPDDLRQLVAERLQAEPAVPWDIAAAEIARKVAT
jgi:hypothetical protein